MLVSVLTLWCYPLLFKGWGLKFQERKERSGLRAGVAFLVGRALSFFSGSYGMKYESGWLSRMPRGINVRAVLCCAPSEQFSLH